MTVRSSGLSVIYHTAVSELSKASSPLVWNGKFRIDCPFCDGGTSKEANTMQLVILPKRPEYPQDHSNGVFFKCYRASCAEQGFVCLDTSITDIVFTEHQKARSATTGGQYTKPLHNIPPEMIKELQSVYPALDKDVLRSCGVKLTQEYECEVDTLYIPLYPYKSSMTVGGYHLRSAWPGYNKITEWDPTSSLHAHRGAWFSSKLAEYKLYKDVLRAEYGQTAPNNIVVVVEDALSALVTARWLPTYALLGATLSNAAAAASFHQADLVLLWTDPDLWDIRPGTSRAPVLDLVTRLSSYCPVVPRKLPCDPKYLTEEAILEYFAEDIEGAIFGESVEKNWEIF